MTDVENHNAEVELLNGTIEDLAESINRLKEQRDGLNVEIRAREARLLTWKNRLAQVLKDCEQDPFDTKPKPRRRKGENLRAIRELLAQNIGQGFSISEVADKLGIAWSSARRTLQKNPIFAEKDDLWYLEPRNNANGDGGGLLS